jgi:hypothetical protein
VILLHAEHLPPQPLVAPQRLGAGAGRGDQVLDHRHGNVVPVQRRVEHRLVAARLRVEPVALQHAVVERRVGVLVPLKRLVVRDERLGAIVLIAVGRDNRAIARVGGFDRFARAQRDGRKLHVGRRQRLVGVVGRRAELRGERQQTLAFFVEHVFLLAIEFLEREAVEGERRQLVEPRADRVARNRQQLRIEPRRGLTPLRQQHLDALTPRVRVVVARVFVVAQRAVVIDLVGELTERVAGLERFEQRRGTVGQRALAAGVGDDLLVQRLIRLFPPLDVREDVGEIPGIGHGEVGALADGRGDGGVRC